MKKQHKNPNLLIALMLGTFMMTGCGTIVKPDGSKSVANTTEETTIESTAAPEETDEDVHMVHGSIYREFANDEVQSQDGTQKIYLSYISSRLEMGELRNGMLDDSTLTDIERNVKNTVNAKISEHLKNIREEFKGLAKDNVEYLVENPDGDYPNNYYNNNTTEIKRCDNRVMSLSFMDESYTGGAHGYTDYYGLTFDMETGKELALEDIVKDRDAFLTVVESELKKDYPEIEDALTVDSLAQGLADLYDRVDGAEMSFVLSQRGLELMFPQYTLTAYAAGPEFVTLNYKDHPELINEKYLETPKYFVEVLQPDTTYSMEDENGNPHEVSYATMYNKEYDMYDGLKIKIDGEEMETKEDFGFYQGIVYLFHTKYGSHMMVECTTDNDLHYVHMVDLQKKKVFDFTDDNYGNFNAPYGDTPLDPDCFSLSKRSYFVSTLDVYKYYHLGKDGLPESDSNCYYYCSRQDFTLKEALDLKTFHDLYDDGAKSTEIKNYSAGTKIQLIRTDDESWFDAVTEDGNYVHVEVDATDWPRRVDGKELESVFDNVFFAG